MSLIGIFLLYPIEMNARSDCGLGSWRLFGSEYEPWIGGEKKPAFVETRFPRDGTKIPQWLDRHQAFQRLDSFDLSCCRAGCGTRAKRAAHAETIQFAL
jgi:hypothetical protein